MTINEKKNAFTEIALERRSVRRFDEAVDISREEMTEILAMAAQAPSSMNMQPWRFFVVNRPQVKEKLLPHVQFNVGPVGTAAAVIAIYGDLESHKNAGEIMGKTDEARGRTPGGAAPDAAPGGGAPPKPPVPAGTNMRGVVAKVYGEMTREQKAAIAQIDCGLVTMQLMQAARVLGYDSVALGAYDKAAIAKELGVDEERYVPIMLLAVGKAAVPGLAPYRMPVSQVATFFG